jgi:hypothetical protein
MTDIAPEQIAKRLRHGDTREDGWRFLYYEARAKNGEYWVSPEMFEQIRKKKAERASARYHANPTEHRQRVSKWQKENPEKRSVYNRRWREKHLGAIQQKLKESKAANPGRYRRMGLEYHHRNYWTNPLYRTAQKLRQRIGSALGRAKGSANTESLLGSKVPDVCLYLESLFLPGMNWDNQTKTGWHIDHIIPLSCAKSEEHLKALCHYTNLRPLWGKENLQKHAKIPSEVPENIRHLLPQNWNE